MQASRRCGADVAVEPDAASVRRKKQIHGDNPIAEDVSRHLSMTTDRHFRDSFVAPNKQRELGAFYYSSTKYHGAVKHGKRTSADGGATPLSLGVDASGAFPATISFAIKRAANEQQRGGRRSCLP